MLPGVRQCSLPLTWHGMKLLVRKPVLQRSRSCTCLHRLRLGSRFNGPQDGFRRRARKGMPLG